MIFKHVILIIENLGENFNVLIMRKFYGKYGNICLVSHTLDQLRIFSDKAANTEKENRQINFIKTTTNATSNHQPSHFISNALTRIQVSKELNNNFNETSLIESSISKFYKVILP